MASLLSALLTLEVLTLLRAVLVLASTLALHAVLVLIPLLLAAPSLFLPLRTLALLFLALPTLTLLFLALLTLALPFLFLALALAVPVRHGLLVLSVPLIVALVGHLNLLGESRT